MSQKQLRQLVKQTMNEIKWTEDSPPEMVDRIVEEIGEHFFKFLSENFSEHPGLKPGTIHRLVAEVEDAVRSAMAKIT